MGAAAAPALAAPPERGTRGRLSSADLWMAGTARAVGRGERSLQLRAVLPESWSARDVARQEGQEESVPKTLGKDSKGREGSGCLRAW